MNQGSDIGAAAIVFGGAGFIGTQLLGALKQQGRFSTLISADMKAPAKPLDGVRYEIVDVRQPIPDLAGPVPCEIFNLAAVHTTPGHQDWEYFWTNINGALEVCAFAERANARRLVFTSSISVYGPTETTRDETGPFTPESAYGRSKYLAEKIHKAWQRGGDRKLVIVRPAVIFGCGEGGNFTRLAKALRRRRFAFPGRSDTVKSCAYVGELVRSILWACDRDEARIVYNLAYPQRYTALQICAAFHRVAGFSMPKLTMPVWFMRLVGLGFELLAQLGLKTEINRARLAKLMNSTDIAPEELVKAGYVFETDLEEGLRRWGQESQGRFV